jgi:hypothetical protein
MHLNLEPNRIVQKTEFRSRFHNCRFRLALSVVCSLTIVGFNSARCEQRTKSARKTLQGTVAQSQLADALSAVGLQSVFDADEERLLVSDVRRGSSAYYDGFLADDEILYVHKKGEDILIYIRRQAALYAAELKPDTTFKLALPENVPLYKNKGFALGVKDMRAAGGVARSSNNIVLNSADGTSDLEKTTRLKGLPNRVDYRSERVYATAVWLHSFEARVGQKAIQRNPKEPGTA